MLRVCAPGFTFREAPHKIRITWRGRTYPSLGTGQHGKRPGRAEIQKGTVKDLVTFFGIEECAKRELEVLR